MATTKKTKTTATTGAAAGAPAKRAAAAKKSSKVATPSKKVTKVAAPPKKAATSATPSAASGATKPIKSAFTKSGLIAHLAEASGADLKTTRAVMATLEATMLASVHKKGLGSFTLPGLLKVNVINVPAKKKRTGIDPFTKEERSYAARPATVKVKTRALKKLKDAAL